MYMVQVKASQRLNIHQSVGSTIHAIAAWTILDRDEAEDLP